MNYKGWVLSIYDEYKRRVSSKKDNKKVKMELKLFFKKENIIITIPLLIYIFSCIVLGFLTIIKKIDSDIFFIYYLIISGIVYLCMMTQSYKYEVTLGYYKNHINMLRDVFKDYDLYNENFIKSLRDYTGGIVFKIKNFSIFTIGNLAIVELLKLIVNVGNERVFLIIAMIMLLSCVLVSIGYLILISIPNSRIVRRQEFHELLKILISQDFESKVESNNKQTKVFKNIIDNVNI